MIFAKIAFFVAARYNKSGIVPHKFAKGMQR